MWILATDYDEIRKSFRDNPNEVFYGIVKPDRLASMGLKDSLVEAAGARAIAITENADGPLVIGGELARELGYLIPDGFVENGLFQVWEKVGKTFMILTMVKGDQQADATPLEGPDLVAWQSWLDGWNEAAKKLGEFFGRAVRTLDANKVSVCFCIPDGDSRYLEKAFFKSLMATKDALRQYGVKFWHVHREGGSNVGKARESVLWQAMKTPATHFFWVDADMTWEPEQFLGLLTSGHDLSAIVGMKKVDPPAPACNVFQGEVNFHPETGFMEMRDVGFAFVCHTREVVEKLCDAYPELKYQAGDGSIESALFLEIVDRDTIPEGERLSEDYSFCRRWRRIGGKIWADPYAGIGHLGTKEFKGKLADFFEPSQPQAVAAE